MNPDWYEPGYEADILVYGDGIHIVTKCVVDSRGTMRFKCNEAIARMGHFLGSLHPTHKTYYMNEIWMDHVRGNITIQEVAEVYCLTGMSVYGFWEVFVWEVNAADKGLENVRIWVEGKEYPDEWEDWFKLGTTIVEIEKENELKDISDKNR